MRSEIPCGFLLFWRQEAATALTRRPTQIVQGNQTRLKQAGILWPPVYNPACLLMLIDGPLAMPFETDP